MRAARLLDLLLVLQRRGRVTARELATLLEVSERTVLRDIEALSEAGVPIYTTRGSRGGVELLDGFQTHLTGLTAVEALCLFLVGQPLVAHRLGLAVPARVARNKLLEALPPALASQADRLSEWFLHDPDPTEGSSPAYGELRRLVRCIHELREVELTLEDRAPLTVRPLGLVLKAGSWKLVIAAMDGACDTLEIDGLRATRITNRRFAAPADFDLTAHWQSVSQL